MAPPREPTMRIYGPNGTTLGSPAATPGGPARPALPCRKRHIDPREPRRHRAQGGGQHRRAAGHARASRTRSNAASARCSAARARSTCWTTSRSGCCRQFQCFHREPAARRRRQPEIHLRRPRPRRRPVRDRAAGRSRTGQSRAVLTTDPAGVLAHRFLPGNPPRCTVCRLPARYCLSQPAAI